ncbi:DUF3349 domain-containing protein [Nocardia sp. alder85J]|uniref:DUF3349 domain-containing protein n=1 Tax=Nocardia sp. alder85J TaxID=2862949 RepID=UPI001CD3E2B3|nr:DUF3349 domain-containing protein [Nocardia sp. alder85J]MCX4092660.1 DUF3349 domain-containing protein [Nocardia sp. alder85J]
MDLPALLAKIVDWLRAGYPHGVPDTDHLPLYALLSRRLSTEEVQQVVDTLVLDGRLPADKADAGAQVTRVTHDMPQESDLGRVRARLVSGGWPVDDSWPGPGAD